MGPTAARFAGRPLTAIGLQDPNAGNDEADIGLNASSVRKTRIADSRGGVE
jgi:hypothetical protein